MSAERDRRLSAGALPFLGMGISGSVSEAVAIARTQLANPDPVFSALGFLSIGVSGLQAVPPELPGLLKQANLRATAHLEDVNLVGELDERRLEAAVEGCKILQPAWVQEDLG